MEDKKKGKVLVIDDNEDILFALNLLLKPLLDDIRVTTKPEQIDKFYDLLQPDVVLLDMNFRRDAISGEEGFEWLEHILHRDAQAVVIMMTAYADADKAVRALKSGATDFITKPWDNSKLLATLFAGIELSRERHKNRLLEQRMEVVASPFGATAAPTIIGESPVMRRVLQTVAQVAPTDANVLILGENGTGKDVIARQLCAQSGRSGKPFVSIDLGSVPEPLFESELFGYEKGAFTDARKAKAGRMETASGGTLFLDEIGNLPLHLQAKLLRALQERKVVPVGSEKAVSVDIRLICATNRDLEAMVREGTFRQDLYFRINVFHLHIPALRERKEDLLPLAEMFVASFAERYHRQVKGLSSAAVEKLRQHRWSGNVRELQNVIERAVILCDGDQLEPSDLEINTTNTTVATTPLEDAEEQTIRAALQRLGGNLSLVAKELGISRPTLYAKLKRYNI